MSDSSKVHHFDSEKNGRITCIYGESGVGKSYLADKLKNHNTIVLDGDSVRHYINYSLTFTLEDRILNNIICADIAELLSSQGFDVIIATVRADIASEYLTKQGIKHKTISIVNHE